MTTAVATTENRSTGLLTADDMRRQVNRVQEVMRAIMVKDVHYGTIPGTPKPTLYKAGSEVLLTTFHIAVEPSVEELREGTHIRYRVKATGRHQASGIVVGVGIGECSTAEEKYAWRRAVCAEEFDETDPTMRRVKFQKYKGSVEKVQQVRTNPADVSNTVLKMAKKRAQIDLCLTATAASDIFTQDIEDLPEGVAGGDDGQQRQGSTMPQADFDALKATLAGAKDRAQLRLILQAAMTKAQAAGDIEAHRALKAHAQDLSVNLPDVIPAEGAAA